MQAFPCTAWFCATIWMVPGTQEVVLVRSPTTWSPSLRSQEVQCLSEHLSTAFYSMTRKRLLVTLKTSSHFTHYVLELIQFKARICWLGCFVGTDAGVSVLKGQEEVHVHAPIVISDAGIFNTYERLLPKDVQTMPGEREPILLFRKKIELIELLKVLDIIIVETSLHWCFCVCDGSVQ